MEEAEQEKTVTLSEDKVELSNKSELSVETTKDENPTVVTSEEDAREKVPATVTSEEVAAEKIDETPAAGANGETPEQEEPEVQVVAEENTVIKIETAPADFRFPTTNQTRHCFTRYIEYHRCIAAKGEGASECDKFAKYYRSLCPSEWVERWNEQRENGTFPGPL